MKRKDIKKGDIFGVIEIICEIETLGKFRIFKTRCINCGMIKEKPSSNIFYRRVGCRCSRKSHNIKKVKDEADIKKKAILGVFNGVKQRCYSNTCAQYKNYGGRGIKCEWNSFKGFYKDMGNTYKEGLTLDRIDNNGNYCKENCRWITNSEQQRNKRNNIFIEGIVLPEFCEKYGLNYSLTVNRIKLGWDLEKIKKYKDSTYSKSVVKQKVYCKFITSYKNKVRYIIKK